MSTSRGMRALPAFLLGTIVCAQTLPQAASSNAPEISAHDAPATFSSRVNLVMVPVVVRDAQGRAIGNLEKGDFQLFDKGKLQGITKFSIEKPGAPVIATVAATDEAAPDKPPIEHRPVPERFIAYLFDDLHLNPGDLARVRQAADRNLGETLEPIDRAAIFTTSGKVMLDFTDDRAKLHDALDRILPQTSALPAPGTECPDLSYYMADAIQNKNDTLLFQEAVNEYLTCNPPPNSDPASVQAATQVAEAAVRGMVSRAVAVGEEESHVTLTVVKDVIRRISAVPGSRSIVLVSPGFYLTDIQRNEEGDVLDRAIRGNVTISSLDARGVYALIPGGDASQPEPVQADGSQIKTQYVIQNATADSDVMGELAEGTGGTFFQNDNGLKQGFRELATQPEYIYLLGFSPQNLKMDGQFHRLKVVVKNPKNLSLQARRGYFAPNHLIDPVQEAKDEIQEAVFSRDEIQDIPVDLHMQFFKASAESAALTVLARVDIKHLHFRKAGDRNDDTLTIVSGVFDRNGNFVTGIQKTVDMRLRDQTLAALPPSGIVVKSVLNVVPGSYMVRLVVRDSEGQTMAARNGAVDIP
jgi:VWFA-related protein